MTTKTDKIRSVLLTLLMVVSVFGGSIAFAGSAAANHDGVDGANDHLDSESTYYAGMQVHINASTASPSDD